MSDEQTDVFEIELTQSEDGFALDAMIDGDDVIGEPGHTVTVNWGDGTGEVLDADSEPHRYSTPGSFDVSALLQRDGLPSQKADAVASPVASEPEPEPKAKKSTKKDDD